MIPHKRVISPGSSHAQQSMWLREDSSCTKALRCKVQGARFIICTEIRRDRACPLDIGCSIQCMLKQYVYYAFLASWFLLKQSLCYAFFVP
jgi:hypothetical protein